MSLVVLIIFSPSWGWMSPSFDVSSFFPFSLSSGIVLDEMVVLLESLISSLKQFFPTRSPVGGMGGW